LIRQELLFPITVISEEKMRLSCLPTHDKGHYHAPSDMPHQLGQQSIPANAARQSGRVVAPIKSEIADASWMRTTPSFFRQLPKSWRRR
jgi:hypothetical protein